MPLLAAGLGPAVEGVAGTASRERASREAVACAGPGRQDRALATLGVDDFDS